MNATAVFKVPQDPIWVFAITPIFFWNLKDLNGLFYLSWFCKAHYITLQLCRWHFQEKLRLQDGSQGKIFNRGRQMQSSQEISVLIHQLFYKWDIMYCQREQRGAHIPNGSTNKLPSLQTPVAHSYNSQDTGWKYLVSINSIYITLFNTRLTKGFTGK